MSFRVILEEEHLGIFTVTPYGSIDSETYIELERQLGSILKETTKLIVFDMAEVNYISSMGIGAILKVKNFLQKHNGSVIITNLQPQLKKAFEILKALPEHLFKNLEEVDAYITQIQRHEIEKKDAERP